MMLPLGFSPFNVGPTETIVVLVIVLILFGGKSCRIWRARWAAAWAIQKGQGRGEKLTNEKGQEIVDDIKSEPERWKAQGLTPPADRRADSPSCPPRSRAPCGWSGSATGGSLGHTALIVRRRFAARHDGGVETGDRSRHPPLQWCRACPFHMVSAIDRLATDAGFQTLVLWVVAGAFCGCCPPPRVCLFHGSPNSTLSR